jgi:hypothetical protein
MSEKTRGRSASEVATIGDSLDIVENFCKSDFNFTGRHVDSNEDQELLFLSK